MKSAASRFRSGVLMLGLTAVVGLWGCAVTERGGGTPHCVPVADMGGELFGMLCGQDALSFQIPAPDGWRPDWETAARLGVGVLLVRGGTNFDDATAVLYPQVYRAGTENQSGAARREAEQTRQAMRDGSAGSGPFLRGPESCVAGDNVFTLYFFDDGPAPNKYEASAFLARGGLLLELVLSARTPAARAEAMPELREVLAGVLMSGTERGATD